MKKVIKLSLPVFLLLTSAVACGNDNKQELEQALLEISNVSITYRSDYEVYCYDLNKITNEETYMELQHFDVYSKFAPNLYELKAYIYGENTVASYFQYEKDTDGYIRSATVNDQNRVEYNYAADSNNQKIPFDESVYINQIGKFNVEDFTGGQNGVFTYTGDLERLPMVLLHGAIPTSSYDLESLTVTIKDGKFDNFVLQEKESTEVYQETETNLYTYGRKVTVKVQDIGTTSIDAVVPFANDETNHPRVDTAIKAARDADNYTITSSAVFENGTELALAKSKITTTDMMREDTDPNTGLTSIMGYHTVNGSVFQTVSTTNGLYGEKLVDGYKIEAHKPKFLFAAQIFEFVEEKDGDYIYSAYSGMESFLDKIDFLMGYSDTYFNQSGKIYITIRNDRLYKVEFPVYITLNNQSVNVTQRLVYSDYGTTEFPANYWDNFTTDTPLVPTYSSWSEMIGQFEKADLSVVEISLQEIINAALGEDADKLPFFLPTTLGVEDIGGNLSKSDDCTYLSFVIPTYNNTDIAYIKNILEVKNGYDYFEIIDEGYSMYSFNNGIADVMIEDYGDGALLVNICLPYATTLE